MTALERLNWVRCKHFEYKRLLTKVEELETLATRTVPSPSLTPEVHSGTKTREDTWTLLMDYKAKCDGKLAEYLLGCRRLEDEIDACIKSERIRTAMKGKFVDCLTVPQIAAAMNYQERQVFRFLRTGENLYSERYKDG